MVAPYVFLIEIDKLIYLYDRQKLDFWTKNHFFLNLWSEQSLPDWEKQGAFSD